MLKKENLEYLLETASAAGWKRVGLRKRSGVGVALFSVYSKKSLGIGDFSDLKLLIDWAHSTGNSIIQLLPMNQVGVTFCPYDAVSSFALEPMYICIRDIKNAKNKSLETKLQNLHKLFPVGSYVDYAIREAKTLFLREVYADIKGADALEFNKFKEENIYWLNDFTLYMVLKDYHKGSPWYDWQEEFKNRNSQSLADFQKNKEEDINFQAWLQWQLFLQFESVKEYAASRKVLLKGDLPILVSRDSADVWVHPELFKLEFAAGAPPDMYCDKGQRWGMPTYNWERIAADDYRYLKEKLKFAENFYDILRIDHVVGLFRCWSIPYNEPMENKGSKGFFDPQDESKWLGHGRNILLAMLNNTDMLLCAEDLGVIPKVCTDTLKELGLCGNDVERWVKDWKIKHDFLSPEGFRELSVAMLSSHDTTNWPAWWENEAGTVDEALFMRKCNERGIDFAQVKEKLFDKSLSCHARLCWLNSVDSVEKLVFILGKRGEEVFDFIELYENTYQEKEKLWAHLGIEGPMRERCDAQILKQALKITLESSSIFCINTLIDLLYLADIFEGDAYQYRINTPGTISAKNWSLTIPISLEQLLKHKVNKEIRKIVVDSGRI